MFQMYFFCFAALIVFGSGSIDSDKVACRPEQVHIAYGDFLNEMVIMWSTVAECDTWVHYGTSAWGMSESVQGTSVTLQNKGSVPYLHRVKLKGLQSNQTYFYSPFSNKVSSGPFFFKTPPEGENWSPELMVYGDLGIHSESLANLETEALKGVYTAILHVGDFGYNLPDIIKEGEYAGQNENNTAAMMLTEKGPEKAQSPKPSLSEVGDVFMRQIEEMASHVPYMVSPGNHEIEADTFDHYRYRFSMPNSDWPIPMNKMWYSLNIGPIHFLSYSSEVFFIAGGMYVESQLAWIKADLEAANNNRHTHPWIIVFGHRPMYCSNNDGDDCTKLDSLVREGLEDVFYHYGVDVVLQAHEHSYERLWPMYKGVVLATNYTNPPAPVQIINGAAGSRHGIDSMTPGLNQSWSAFRMDNKSFNSFGRLKVYNSTHLYWEQVGVLDGEVLDSIWVIQESHGPFTETVLKPDQKEKINKQKEIEQQEKERRKPKPSTSGDTLTAKVSKAIQGADIKLVVGVSCGAGLILLVCLVCVIRRCCCRRSRPISYRRWETLDYGKKFYSNVKNDEKDADDFEVDVTDGSTKLIGNGGD